VGGRVRPFYRRVYELYSFRENTSQGIIQGSGSDMIFTGVGAKCLCVSRFAAAFRVVDAAGGGCFRSDMPEKSCSTFHTSGFSH
jgi:hypothetical protein